MEKVIVENPQPGINYWTDLDGWPPNWANVLVWGDTGWWNHRPSEGGECWRLQSAPPERPPEPQWEWLTHGHAFVRLGFGGEPVCHSHVIRLLNEAGVKP